MSQQGVPVRLTFLTPPATREQRAGIFPSDEPLGEEAIARLGAVRWRVRVGERVWSSPERRAVGCAEGLGLTPEVAPELRECDFDGWRGRGLEELCGEDADGVGQWLEDVTAAPHGGESYAELMARVAGWMDGLGEAAVVVTHASVVRVAVVHALSAPVEAFLRVEVGQLTRTELVRHRGQWRLRSVGVPLGSE